jgi:hypothetical protein
MFVKPKVFYPNSAPCISSFSLKDGTNLGRLMGRAMPDEIEGKGSRRVNCIQWTETERMIPKY